MIPVRLHAALDALSVAGLVLGPRAAGWPRNLSGPLAAAGAFVAAYSLATRYEEGSSGVLSLGEHRALDAMQGAGFCAAALNRRLPVEARVAMGGYGAFSLLAAALTDPGPEVRQVGRQLPLPRGAVRRRPGPGRTWQVAPGVHYLRLGIVNVAFLGEVGAGDRGWTLVDAGLPGSAGAIRRAAEALFGPGARPARILLTHGHFDHVGALETLAEAWDAPVLAHAAERPHLDGSRDYPPGDPSVGGGLMARAAPLYPTGPADVGARLSDLPADGTVPGLSGWRWIATPGHAPGHVSLWRAADRVLLAGDAVVTVRQEEAYAVARQRPELHGPPAYFTPDWEEARASARRLAALAPEVLLAGHGVPVGGPALRAGLGRLAREFDRIARPRGSRYDLHPDLR
nr:MBL fold metallo-hydrolase [Cereibacter sphaeroides f. sp. denitrificans]